MALNRYGYKLRSMVPPPVQKGLGMAPAPQPIGLAPVNQRYTPAAGAELQPGAPTPYQPQAMAPAQPGAAKPMNPKRIQKQLLLQQYQMQQQLQPQLMAQLGTLTNQANQNQFTGEGRAAYLAPRLSALDDQQQLATSRLNQGLAARGLDSSSETVSQFANLGGRYSAARAGLTNDLYNAEEQRQLQAQDQLRQMLSSLYGNSVQQAGGIASTARNQNLQQQQFQAQLDQMSGFDWGGLLSSIGGIGGMAAGLGWNPFGGGGGGASSMISMNSLAPRSYYG